MLENSNSKNLLVLTDIENDSEFLSDIIPIITSNTIKNETSIVINNTNLLFCLNILKNHINYQYSLLSCITGVDLLNKNYRFGIFYDILSLKHNSRLRIKVYLNELTVIHTSIPIYVNANWWEREIWDMFGIYFQNHPELRRLLTDYGFEGYPLRKDFPVVGFIDSYYDNFYKKVSLTNIELAQDYRPSLHHNSW